MRLKFKVLLLLPILNLALAFEVIDLSLEYFKGFGIKFVCALSCQDAGLLCNFTKSASNEGIYTSHVTNENLYNVEHLKSCLKQNYHLIGVLVHAKCSAFEDIVYYASQNMWFDSRHYWMIIIGNDHESKKITIKERNANISFNDNGCNDNNTDINALPDRKEIISYKEGIKEFTKVVNVLSNLNISVDTDIVLAKKERIGYELYEIFNYGKIQGGDVNIVHYGGWNLNKGFHFTSSGYKYYRRWDFKGWSMRIVVVVYNIPPEIFDPEMIIGPKEYPGVPIVMKITTSCLNVVAEIHNIKFKYTLSDRWIGDFTKNTSKVVATSLYYREQDISPLIRMIIDVYEKIDVVHPPLTSLGTKFYYKIPTSGPGKFENKFVQPLSDDVWLCVVGVLSLCAAVLLVAAKLENRPAWGQYAFFSVLALICQQFFEDDANVDPSPFSTARQLTVLVTGASSVLIYNYYTSSVVSWLLNGPPPSINSLEELLGSPLGLILEDVGYSRSWIQTPSYYFNMKHAEVEDKLRKKKIFTKKPNDPLLVSLEKGIDMIKAGGYAFHTESNSANRLISQKFTQAEMCEMGSLQSMEDSYLYPAVQKNSPYKEFWVWNLIRLTESGIVSCIQRRSNSPTARCEGSSPRALALGGAAPAFMLLGLGFLAGTVIMILERMYYFKLQRNNH